MNQATEKRCREIQQASAHSYRIAQMLVRDAYKTDFLEDTYTSFEIAVYEQQRAARYAALALSILTDE